MGRWFIDLTLQLPCFHQLKHNCFNHMPEGYVRMRRKYFVLFEVLEAIGELILRDSLLNLDEMVEF